MKLYVDFFVVSKLNHYEEKLILNTIDCHSELLTNSVKKLANTLHSNTWLQNTSTKNPT